MTIKKTKQDWTPGKVVTIGFMRLKVLRAVKSRDGSPDIHQLETLDGKTKYEFVPFHGLSRGHAHSSKDSDGTPTPPPAPRRRQKEAAVATAGSVDAAPVSDAAVEAVARPARRGQLPRTNKESKDYQSIFDRQRDEIAELRQSFADAKAIIAGLEAHIVKQDNLIAKLKGD